MTSLRRGIRPLREMCSPLTPRNSSSSSLRIELKFIPCRALPMVLSKICFRLSSSLAGRSSLAQLDGSMDERVTTIAAVQALGMSDWRQAGRYRLPRLFAKALQMSNDQGRQAGINKHYLPEFNSGLSTSSYESGPTFILLNHKQISFKKRNIATICSWFNLTRAIWLYGLESAVPVGVDILF